MILALLGIVGMRAQDISVTEFYLDESDLTANRAAVMDQNGRKCALIRIQTTQKEFLFDVGSLGITKTEENHVGEIWLWVPHGIKHISIRHQQLGSLSNYYFPEPIQRAHTYIMKITHEQVFVNTYDDTKKQKLSIKITPPNATLSLNGMSVELDPKGEAIKEMAHGKFTYKIEAEGFYPKEGQIIVDEQNHLLVVDGLNPIKGKLTVHVTPSTADVHVDGRAVGQSIIEPIELPIGKHEVIVSAKGYKSEIRTVEITENQTMDVAVTLSQIADYTFASHPSDATVYVNGEFIGFTPCTKEYATGFYTVKVAKTGYENYEESLSLSSSNPNVQISLKKTYNYRNEFYVEGNVRAGTSTAFGASLGGYFSHVNVEASYLYGMGESEIIYWSDNDTQPMASHYTPAMNVSAKIGYGIPIANRFRITPQIGMNCLKLTETMESDVGITPADGANIVSGLVSLRLSAAIVDHLAISLSPEYSFAMLKSEGYTALAEVSPKIKNWGEGFNVKLGITAFF